jgi:DeoR/GlpR family transcriptional regulator of sugar metabolism
MAELSETSPKPAPAKQKERIETIVKLIKRIGLGNIHRGQLAKELNVSEKTIQRDIKKIIKEWSPEDLKITGIRIGEALYAALDDAHKTLATGDSKAKSAARKDIAIIAEKMIEAYEKMGWKKSIPTEFIIKWKEKQLAKK